MKFEMYRSHVGKIENPRGKISRSMPLTLTVKDNRNNMHLFYMSLFSVGHVKWSLLKFSGLVIKIKGTVTLHEVRGILRFAVEITDDTKFCMGCGCTEIRNSWSRPEVYM